ncbi:MAG: hypothetical protein LBL45_00315, partial [Treponema sp.]|nr:hypothetical protein [Treponema sp.]
MKKLRAGLSPAFSHAPVFASCASSTPARAIAPPPSNRSYTGDEMSAAIPVDERGGRLRYEPRRDGNQISIIYKTDDFITIRFDTVEAAGMSGRKMFIWAAPANGKRPEQTPLQTTMIPGWKSDAFSLDNAVAGFRLDVVGGGGGGGGGAGGAGRPPRRP